MGIRVVGLGQRSAGDDGVGPAILDALRGRRLPDGTELVHLTDPMDLVTLLADKEHVVLVDAVLGSPPGVVVDLAPDKLSREPRLAASSHGMGAAEAIELARVLSLGDPIRDLRIVGVTIERPDRPRSELSPRVAAAVPLAADRILSLLEAEHA